MKNQLNLTLTEEGKQLSFSKFKDQFGDHFKNKNPAKHETVEECYTRLTGKEVGNTGQSNKAARESSAPVSTGSIKSN